MREVDSPGKIYWNRFPSRARALSCCPMAREISASLPRRRIGVPRSRRRAARQVASAIEPGMRVALTTHVNADGDGVGSEIGLWHLIKARGALPVIVNPTPFPPRYQFLLEDADGADRSNRAVKELERADLVVVLDISDLGRLGHLAQRIEGLKVPVACVDHHQSNGSLPDGPRFVDAAACATGELVHDLARVAKWDLPQVAAQALYVAILTDTGGFRFSNTSPRALHVASHLLAHGLDPEQIYTQVYASAQIGRAHV